MALRPGNRYQPHYEESEWFGLFEGKRKRIERERRNAENEQNFKRWRAGYLRKRRFLLLVWVAGLVLLIHMNASVAYSMIWSLLALVGYLYLKASSEPPPPSKYVCTGEDEDANYAAKLGGGGLLTGAIAGAYFGAGVGIVGGPFGAIAGTIPGALIGGLLGLFGGHKAGTFLEEPKALSPSQAELAVRKKQAGRVGGWAGLTAGAAGGAWYGAGIGIAAGPLGAIAGTIPGLIAGGILGYLGGENVGSRITQVLPSDGSGARKIAPTVDSTGQKRLQ